MIGPYPAYAVLDGHGGFECAEIFSNFLISIMRDNLSDDLPDTETRNSPLFWEESFNQGVAVCDEMVKGSSGKEYYESYGMSHII